MSPPRRRCLRALSGAALLTGLAGCSGTPPGGTGGPEVRLVGTDPDGSLPVRPAVKVVRDTATPERPPRLRTTLTNASDDPVTVGEGRAVHFEYVTDDSRTLILLPGETDREYPVDPDCWRLTERIAVTEEYRTFDIDPGATSSRSVDLYGLPDIVDCLPIGDYRFETTISTGPAAAELETSATWGFSIALE